jgi:hypothetical protein
MHASYFVDDLIYSTIGCSHEMKTMVEKKLRCKCGIQATSSRPSAMASQVIAGIEVKCINHETGCNERMTLGKGFNTLSNHLTTCKGVKIECYQCAAIMSRELLDTHLIADCPFRWITCQHCNRTMMSCQMNDHLITATIFIFSITSKTTFIWPDPSQ